jgi:pimeloyl-ACP methyl ester carboxylesterase
VALNPRARLEVVADAGHMAPMERPAEMAALLARWLQRV